ncbi:hypothetical protein TgHK011_009939 [Trichoderma gracile]|nr:hypothetical protein TgHK011_009939 [Trichoderma gracile]
MSDWESDYSTSDDEESSKRCPHVRFDRDGSLFGAGASRQVIIDASAGCIECKLLLQAVSNYKPGWIEDDDDKTRLIHLTKRKTYTVQLLRGSYDSEPVGTFQILHRSKDEPMYETEDKKSNNILRRPRAQGLQVISDSSSQAAMDRAAQWLSHCLEHDDESSREPFLFKPTSVAPYACLSYCWGPDTEGILQTTTKNVESHHEAIPLAKMPNAVQDAVAVCRGLKIPYLAIKLQIEIPRCADIFVRPVDDDFNEEKEEDTKRSLDKRGWCLQESLLPSRRLCFTGDEMIWECLCRTVCECGHILWQPQPFGFGRLGAHLKTKRLKAEVSISHPQPARPWYEEYHGYNYYRSGDGYPETPYRRWRDIVSEYSQRFLSRRKDRLSAVSGLAKLVREGLPGTGKDEDGEQAEEYLAGLWKREFHFDLTWTVQHPNARPGDSSNRKVGSMVKRKVQEDGNLRIPSWSWASVEAPVKFEFDRPLETWKYAPNLIDLVRLESASCERELEHDETSAVTSGEVVLTGLISSVQLKAAQGSPREGNAILQSATSFSAEVTLDQPGTLASLSSSCRMPSCEEENCQHERGKAQDEGLLCLALFSWIAFTWKYDADGKMRKMGPNTWFLVLKPSTSVPGAYERIGIGSHSSGTGERCELFEDGKTATVKIV